MASRSETGDPVAVRRARIRERTAALDVHQLLAAIGGLHLMPENVQQLIELKLTACVAAAHECTGSRKVEREALRSLLTHPATRLPIPRQAPNLFTTTITHTRGCDILFSGQEEDGDWIVARVLEAVASLDVAAFSEDVAGFAATAFALSSALARRAGLSRNAPGKIRPLAPVEVPGNARLRSLSQAAAFAPADLEAIAGPEWETILAPLIADLPEPLPEGTNLSSRLTWRPLVRRPSGGLTVVFPDCIATGVRHAIVRSALERGLREDLEKAFAHVVDVRTRAALGRLGVLLGHPVTSEAGFPREAWLPMDADKTLHLTLLLDGLDTYESEDPSAPADLGAPTEVVETALRRAELAIFEAHPDDNEILHLFVVQTMGRPFTFEVRPPQPPLFAPRLVLSVPELEVIAAVEDPDLLLLWRFAQAASRLRSLVPLLPISQLDEFAAWREAGYSFAPLTMMAAGADRPVELLPGSALALRTEIATRFDPHGVVGPSGEPVEVRRFLEDPAVELYVPAPSPFVEPHFYVSSYEAPVWIVGIGLGPDPREAEVVQNWTELIAYWLWQLRPHLGPLRVAIEAVPNPLVIELELIDGPSDEPFAVAAAGNRLVSLRVFLAQASAALGRPDNEAERLLVAGVLMAVAEAVDCAAFDGAGAADVVVEHMAPQRRKLIFTRHEDPAVRAVTAAVRTGVRAEVDPLMHEIGFELAERHALSPGPVPGDLTHRLLNDAVSLLYARLQGLIATLRGDRLLEWLVSHNEALIHLGVVRALELAGEAECYGPHAAAAERYGQLRSDLSRGSVASRFLIEYAAAQPPRGLRPISYSAYDTLLVVAIQLTELGTLSDLVAYGIDDVEAVLFPTGLFAAYSTGHSSSTREYSHVSALGDIRRSGENLEQRLRGAEPYVEPDPPGEIDAAFEAEYGFGLIEIAKAFNGLIDHGLDATGAVILPLSEAESLIAESASRDAAFATSFLEQFSLQSRESFLEPPNGLEATDVYPWRHNRQLSYLRRPLLVKDRPEPQLVYGPAGVFRAVEYLLELVSTGRLRARTRELQTVVSRAQRERGQEFNDRVADLYADRSDLVVRRRVTKVSTYRIERSPAEPLGDVDVLVAAPASRVLLAVETKALAGALTPHQLKNEIEKTFSRGAGSAIDRLEERVAWLRRHLDDVLEWLEITGRPSRWRVSSLVVIDEEVLSSLVREVPVPVRSWHQLSSAVAVGDLW